MQVQPSPQQQHPHPQQQQQQQQQHQQQHQQQQPQQHLQQASYHAHPTPSNPFYTPAADDMQPYHQQYQGAYGQPQASRAYQPQGQLPSLQQMGAMGAPHMPSGSGGPGYSALSQQPPYLSGVSSLHQPVLPQPGHHQQPMSVPSHRQPVKLQHSGQDEKYQYKLVVEQQPQRARMCGFGDKDRRPITPPPCIRLLILDKVTGKEIDFGDIDGTFFVLQVDLWDKEAEREVNIVRASSSSPAVSISTATTTSFPPTPERLDPMGRSMMYGGAEGGHPYHAGFGGYPHAGMSGAPGYSNMSYPAYQPYAAAPYAAQQPNSVFTRNLIGSLTVNASRLNDPNGKTGYWFVLQDLSVRTEGHFRSVSSH